MIHLERGDVLLLYTDGITEAMSPPRESDRRELFGLDRLDRALLEHAGTSARECVQRICAQVDAFSESVSQDDQTLIAVRCM